MKTHLLVFVVVLVVGAAVAAAGGTWSDKVNFRRSSQTSIKIVEPEGFKVVVTMPDGSEKVGTVPELFNLPDQDAFVKVTITPTDGSTPWSKKIEVRSNQQTELAVSFKADAPKGEPAKAARSFIGRMVNRAGGCGKAWEHSIRVEFVRNADGTSVKFVQIEPNKNVDVQLPTEKYDVRVSIWNGSEFKFVMTSTHDVKKDGWSLGFGCLQGKRTPIVIENP